ncbi:hypothetical protein Tsubulata_020230 [Turnera subulata]|uniref:Protein FLUORESCENT IN BLUE LIGHT, chloroplastic n=1 Tax=Turnera subulata TaxID=218843 RepID=A0A9Q0FZJ1_9ROSI|nr:hypothetical protein Tsubulata_020230 [Turnera subulata]
MVAVIIRSACFSSRPSPPSDPITSGRPHLPCKFASLLFKVGKLRSSVGEASAALSVFCRKLPAGQSLTLGPKSECRGIIHVQPPHDKLFKQFSAHQGKVQLKSSALLLVANAIMWSTPLEALAETCEAADNSFMSMPLLLFVALVGATVGGLLARQRRGELQRLNEQLRQINAALRRQAKIESYAPSLSYAPTGSSRIPETEVIVDPRKQELISRLKAGKNHLRNQDPEKAFVEFKAGLELAQIVKDPIEEKKAARGLGASLQRQGKHREAIKYHSLVLAISDREGEDSGSTEAYGAIADCYTELGDLEQAAKYYDNYIARLEKD